MSLYILLRKVRTLSEWADGLQSKMLGAGRDKRHTFAFRRGICQECHERHPCKKMVVGKMFKNYIHKLTVIYNVYIISRIQ